MRALVVETEDIKLRFPTLRFPFFKNEEDTLYYLNENEKKGGKAKDIVFNKSRLFKKLCPWCWFVK
jgi:hypothetical protein